MFAKKQKLTLEVINSTLRSIKLDENISECWEVFVKQETKDSAASTA